MVVEKTVDFGHFGLKFELLSFTNLTKNLWDYKTRGLTSGAIHVFLASLGKIWEHFKDRRVGEKSKPIFLPFLKVHDQLQTTGISKRFDAQKQDWTELVDFLA